MDNFPRTLLTLLLATAGGILFYVLSIPLAWMLGPLCTVVIWNRVAAAPLFFSTSIRNAALVVLGYVIGKAFSASTAEQISNQLFVMLLVTILVVGLSLVLGYVTHRQTGISLTTGLMGSIPGGFSQMVLMSEEACDADVSVVSFMHTIRLLSVLFIVPHLATQAAGKVAGITVPSTSSAALNFSFSAIPTAAIPILLFCVLVALFFHKMNWPTPFLMGPIIGAAMASMYGFPCPPLPSWLTIFCQIAVGAYMGVKIELANLANWRALLFYTFLGVVIIIFVSLGLGFLLSNYYGFTDVTAFLSMAPGGIAEMSVTGIALNADLSVIASYQLFRLFFILFLTPLFFRRLFKYSRSR